MTPSRWRIALVAGALGLLALPATASADGGAGSLEGSSRWIVTTAPGLDLSAAGLDGDPIAPSTYVVETPAGTSAADLADEPGVLRVQPDIVYRAAAVPNDPAFPQQTYLNVIRAPAAWDTARGAAGVVVAVLDTQVDITHPDLQGKIAPGGGDFVSGVATCSVGSGASDHGTAVAGLIGAATDNAVGMAGVGWNTRVLPMRVLCDDGQGSTSTVAPAVRAAADRGAGIINLSIAERCPSAGTDSVLAEAIAYAQGKGVIVVAAAGNAGCTTPVQPGSLPGVVAVGSSELDDRISDFSNRGTWVDVVAPGRAVTSLARNGGLSTFTGTSFSAPQVAGALALAVAAYPGITPTRAVERLRLGADAIPGTGSTVAWGRLDVADLVAGPPVGYWVAASSGQVLPFGDAGVLPRTGGALSAPVAAIAATPSGAGYWVAGTDGSVAAFGDAGFYGSMAGIPLQRPVVGMAPTRSGLGYWLVASDGGIFAFGDAPFYGSMGGRFLVRPVVGMAPSKGGAGYWLVASDGGIFAFGDAPFAGSMGGQFLFRPVVGMAPSPSGLGYWLVASDGGIFAFGDAPFRGSIGGQVLNQPVVAVTPTRSGQGYWFIAADGGVFAFGDAPFLGSAVGAVTAPVVSLAAR